MLQHLKETMVALLANLAADACSGRDSHETEIPQATREQWTASPYSSPQPTTLPMLPRLEQTPPSIFDCFAKTQLPRVFPKHTDGW